MIFFLFQEFLVEFKEKKNVLKYYFQIIEKSVGDGGIEFVYRSQLSRTGDLFQQIILQVSTLNTN